VPTVSELKVVVAADTRQLESGLRAANESVRAFAGQAEQAGRGVSALFSSVIPGAVAVAAGMIGVKLVGAVAGAVGGIARLGVSFNAQMEQAKAGFTTLLGSAEKAQAFLRELADFARTSPFTMESSLRGAQNLMAMGFAARDVIPWLKTIGNVSAALGGSSETYFQIAYALGQIQARGKLAGQEILQLANAGVNVNQVFEVMSQQTGKSVAELKKMQEQGQITADMFLRAFREWSETRFGDALANQANTFSGALSNLKDTLRITVGEALSPFFEFLKRIVVGLADLVNAPGFSRFAETVKGAMTMAFSAVSEIGGRIVEWIRRHLTWEDVERAFVALVVAVRTGWEILKTVVTTVGATVVSVGKAIANALSPVGRAVSDAMSSAARETGQANRSFAYWAGFTTGMITRVVTALGGLVQAFATAFGSILRIVTTVGTLIARVMVALLSPFSRHSPSLVEQVQMGTQAIGEAWQSLEQRVRPVFQRIGDGMRELGTAAREAATTAAGVWRDEFLPSVTRVLAGVTTAVDETARTIARRLAGDIGGAMAAFRDQAMEWWGGLVRGDLIDEDLTAVAQRIREFAGTSAAVLQTLSASVLQLWDDFRSGNVTAEEARTRLEALKTAAEQASGGFEAFQTFVQQLQGEIRRLDDEIRELEQRIKNLAQMPLVGEGAAQEQIRRLELQKDLLEAAKSAVESGAGARYTTEIQRALDQTNQALAEAVAAGASPEQIRRLEELRDAYQQALGYATMDAETLEKQLEQVNQQLEASQRLSDVTFGAMHEVLQGLGERPQAETPFSELTKQIIAATQALDDLIERREGLQEIYTGAQSVADSFQAGMQNVSKLTETLENVIPKLEEAAGGGGGVADALGDAALNSEDLSAKLEDMKSPLSDIEQAMKDFEQGVQDANTRFGDLKTTIDDINEKAKAFSEWLDKWSQKIEEFKGKLEPIRGAASFALQPERLLAGPVAGPVVDVANLLPLPEDVKREVTEWALKVGSPAYQAWSLWRDLQKDETQQAAKDVFKGALDFAIDQLPQGVQDKLPTLAAVGGSVVEQIGKGMENSSDPVKRAVGSVLSRIGGWIEEHAGDLKSDGSKVTAHLGSGVEQEKPTLVKSAENAIRGIGSWITDNAGTLTDWGKSIASTIADAVASKKDDLKKKFDEFVHGIKEWIDDKVGTFTEWGKQIASAIADGIRSIKLPLPSVSVGVKWVDPDQSGPIPSIPVPTFDVKWMQSGGIVRRPTLLGAGEAGPEAILPLDSRGVSVLADALARALLAVNARAGTATPTYQVRIYLGERELRDVVKQTIVEALR
jgi:tape measure domain-containing protein